MKRSVLIFMLVLCLCTFSFLNASAETVREVFYFYENYCEACSPEEDFAEYFRSLTGSSIEDFDYLAYNVVHSSGRQAFDDAVSRYDIENPSLPLTIVDGIAYCGASEMESDLPAAALSWGGSTDSVIVYLYVPACESCARAAAVLETLPDSVTLRRGSLEIDSPVIVERIDISAQPETARRLFEDYAIPDDERISPIVFFADRYLSGADAIEKNLDAMVRLGWAAGGIALPASEAAPSAPSALDFIGTLGAGLVAGLNTCALSMLLLFLSLVLESRKNAPLLAGCFLGAKFVCYLLIGFVLTEMLQKFNPHWLQPLAKGVLTVMGSALIGLNLWDAVQARKENYGKIRNQLPAGMRNRLHRLIRSMTGTKVLVPAAVALGFLVALGEFLCAGQLFLMQLLSGVKSGSGAHIANLLIYCLAFIAPSAILCIIVLRGKSQMRVSAFLAEHMSAAKLITAAVMLALILSAWLL